VFSSFLILLFYFAINLLGFYFVCTFFASILFISHVNIPTKHWWKKMQKGNFLCDFSIIFLHLYTIKAVYPTSKSGRVVIFILSIFCYFLSCPLIKPFLVPRPPRFKGTVAQDLWTLFFSWIDIPLSIDSPYKIFLIFLAISGRCRYSGNSFSLPG